MMAASLASDVGAPRRAPSDVVACLGRAARRWGLGTAHEQAARKPSAVGRLATGQLARWWRAILV